MNKLLTLKKCSHPEDGGHVVFCNRQANLHMQCENSQLLRIEVSAANPQFVWHNSATSFEFPEFVRAFCFEETEPIDAFKNVHPVAPDEAFCFNGRCYYLAENEAKTFSIRQVDIYCSQKLIEQISYYNCLPETVSEIYLVNIYRIGHGKEFAYAAWVVEYPSVNFHIPVVDADGCEMCELLDTSLYLEERIRVGETFVQNGRNYQVVLDKEKKLHLAEVSAEFLSDKARKITMLFDERKLRSERQNENVNAKILPLM